MSDAAEKVGPAGGGDRNGSGGGGGRDDAGSGVRSHGGDDARGAVSPIPGSIVKAICRVQASVEAVAKTQYNKQGGYKFASADDIYAAVARKFGEAGLLIYPVEMRQPEIRRVEKTDKQSGQIVVSQWGLFSFGYVLATEDATWFDHRSSRTIFIQILGPQTFNAAESYCQKQYLRALLKLPTGDQDLDSLPQADTEDDQIALNANGRRPRKSSAEGKRDGTDRLFNEICADIKQAISPDHLRHIRTARADEWAAMPARWSEMLDDEYETRMSAFIAQAAE
jgi:hypothetical protein